MRPQGVSPGARPDATATEPAPDRSTPGRAWLYTVTVAATLGVAAGLRDTRLGAWWLAPAFASAALAVLLSLRPRTPLATLAIATAAVFFAAAGWAAVRTQHVWPGHVSQYLVDQPQLARVTGVVERDIFIAPPQRGTFAPFSHEQPVSLFSLRIQTIEVDGSPRPTTGRLMMKIGEADHRLVHGSRIEATGWLADLSPPMNPGERPVVKTFAGRDIDGRLVMPLRGNWRLLEPPGPESLLPRTRQGLADATVRSLRLGLRDEPVRVAFLDRILLGRTSRDAMELNESFKRTGLAHLLAISGAHLGILMGLAWVVLRVFVHHPPRLALLLIALLGMFLCCVPLNVPVVRAGIMAGVMCVGYALGRRLGALEMLCVAALIVLAWRPQDLVSPGFQLSFGVVLAMLLFTRRVSRWIHPPDPLGRRPTRGDRWCRFGCDVLAVNIVAFLASLPLVACHFQMVSPLALPLSIVALPLVTAVLGLGYLKAAVGVLLPSAGSLLARPLEWSADVMIALVEHAASWPGVALELHAPPSAAWAAATLAVTFTILAGGTTKRPRPALACVAICLAWLVVPQFVTRQAQDQATAALTLHMLAVGDGSCFVVRVDGHTLMFDCGSQQNMDVGTRAVVPALRALGVDRIDTLLLSHADLDHYCGALDVADRLPVGRVIVSPQMVDEAKRRAPDSEAAQRQADDDAAWEDVPALVFLFNELRRRGLRIETASAGWSEAWGDTRAALLWPPADFTSGGNNDTSLVLSLRVAGRHVLLSGDVQRAAIPLLLKRPESLRADVADLPHHGSFVDSSPRWLEAVDPGVALQSSGPARLLVDPWAELFASRPRTQRLITQRHGLATVTISRDGEIAWDTFRKQEPAPR